MKWPLAILLCLATVYCRYHYAVDVIAGVVTAAVLIPLGNALYFRFQGGTAKEIKQARRAAIDEPL